MSQAFIVDVTLNTIQARVMQQSKHTAVILSFWSELNEPSHQANAQFEKIILEHQGKVVLAKVNIDQEKDIASKFSVNEVPFYKVIKNNQIITEGKGKLTEEAIRALIHPHLQEDPSEPLRKQATQLFSQGQFDQAIERLGQASKANPNNVKVPLDLVQMYLQIGYLEHAQNLLQTLPPEAQNSPLGKLVQGTLFFTDIVNASPRFDEIQATLAKQPHDPASLMGLAAHLILKRQYEAALETLFTLYTHARYYQDNLPQKTLLKAFDMLSGPAPDLVASQRRAFQSLLF